MSRNSRGGRLVADDVIMRPERTAPAWLIWTALWIVYIVWGSTYLAIRVVVETMPPMLSAGVRFVIAGLIAYVWLAVKRKGFPRVTKREVVAATFVGGALLLGGNGLVMTAEQYVPSGLAALIIASVPLWVVVLRFVNRDPVPKATLVGVAVGFAGVGLLLLPSDNGGGHLMGSLMLIAAAASWASGSFFSKSLPLPRDIFVSTAVQMLCGGALLLLVGLVRGEAGGLSLSAFSTGSLVALGYLVFIGSLLAFTAYVWLLQHAPISQVATYAYVNPVIALLLGWGFLSERVSPLMFVGAAVVVGSVAFTVSKESQPVDAEKRSLPVEPALAAERA